MSPRFLILILAAIALPAHAGELSLTAEGAANYALKHNATLAAARLRIDEASGRLQQSGRLSNPELDVNLSRNTRDPEGSASIGFTQRFPLTARLRFEKAVSRAELSAAESEVHDAERKLAAEVRTASVKVLAIQGQRELRSRQLGNSRELSDFLLKRVASGEASQVDASQVDLETQQIGIEDFALAADESVLLGELRPLLGLGRTTQFQITGKLPAPREIPDSRDVTNRPDILAAESRAQAAKSQVLEQRARRWEDVGIGASYTRDRAVDEPQPAETDQILGLQFSLPLPIWNNNAGRIREAEAAAVRASKEVEAARIQANAEVAATLGTMRAYAKLIGELDDKVLPAATRIEEQFRSSYSTGHSPLIDVLRARTRRLDLERQRLDALRDYEIARIRNEAAAGKFETQRKQPHS